MLLPVVVAGLFAVTFAAVAGVLLAGRKLQAKPEPGAEAAPEPEGDAETPFDWLTPVQAPGLLREEVLSSVPLWDRVLGSVDAVKIMKAHMAEAGVQWSVGRITAMMLLGGAATFAVLWPMTWVPAVVAVGASLLAAAGPYLSVRRRRDKRLRRVGEQFPDALDSLARSLRAGNSLAAAFETLAREAPQPLAGEFRTTLNERNLGGNWDQALQKLAARLPVSEVSVFAAALQLQSRTGGKLHEVLARLAETMRESAALKGEVRSIAAHGRMTGAILTGLPVVIGLIMSWVNPQQMFLLWTNPTGYKLVWAALICLGLAHVVIRKMVDIRI